MEKVSLENIGERLHSRFGTILIVPILFFAVTVSAQAHDVKCNTPEGLINAELNYNGQMHVGDEQVKFQTSSATQVTSKLSEDDLSDRELPDRFFEDNNSAVDRSRVQEYPERRKTGDVDADFYNDLNQEEAWIDWRWEGKDE